MGGLDGVGRGNRLWWPVGSIWVEDLRYAGPKQAGHSWTDFCNALGMQTLYLLQAAGPLHQQPVLEQLLLDHILVFESDVAPDFPETPAPLAGEWQFLWRTTSRVVLLEAPVYPVPSAQQLAAERAALYGNAQPGAAPGAGANSVPPAQQLPAVGRLFSLQPEPDAQLLLRMYQYAISPELSQAELLAFLPLGLMKGAWVWGEVLFEASTSLISSFTFEQKP